jgi:hypothetical protein
MKCCEDETGLRKTSILGAMERATDLHGRQCEKGPIPATGYSAQSPVRNAIHEMSFAGPRGREAVQQR